MKVKEKHGSRWALLAVGMRSLFMRKSPAELHRSDEESERFSRRFEKSLRRKLPGEELIVFTAFASAYLLAWAASKVFQQ
jgi:hypothetical protein